MLREKLRNTKMFELETVASYLTRVEKVQDELGVVGVAFLDDELVRTTLSRFSKPWDTFVISVLASKHLLDWNKLWDDFI